MSGRAETVNIIPGRYALSVGSPQLPAPENWSWAKLIDIAQLESGHTPSRKVPGYWDGDIPWIGIKDARLHHGRVIFETLQTVSEEGLENSAARLLPVGTVCLSRTASVGYSFVMGRSMATSQDFVNWICSEAVDPKFLMHLFILEKQSLLSFGRGTTHKTIYYPEVKAFHICVPPLNEQRRIVAKVEALQERSQSARSALESIPPLLDKFRQSVLAAAFRGDLTADWRAKNSGAEPATVLLERIRVERRKRWEQTELAKMEAKGKVPKNDKWKSKYKESIGPNVAELPELPSGWCWATVDQIGTVQGGIQKGKKRKPGEVLEEVPYLRVANVQRGFIDLRTLLEIPVTKEEIEKLRLEPGDILFNEGGDRDKLGRGWVWQGEYDLCIHQNHVFRARLFLKEIQPKLVSWFGNTEGKEYFMREGKQTTNLASLNSTKLRSLPVPVAPSREQDFLVSRIDELLVSVDSLSASVGHQTLKLDKLDQSILGNAFEGKLVPQDGEDEPASNLLNRVRQERATIPKQPTKRRRRKQGQVRSKAAMMTRNEIQESHLATILEESGPLAPEALWKASQLSIDDFYDQLKDEESRGLLVEKVDGADSLLRLLEAAA